jgi:7-carboxy-7-deazaguanine synthase (Cx14CxxC type)
LTYSVKEIFYTLQGEGAQRGRPAVFCRFSGCNLWSGREQDRAEAACNFCDTDFVGTDGAGGGKFSSAGELAEAVKAAWPASGRPLVVCTGGEPLLQLDSPLIREFHRLGLEIAVETNGTQLPPPGIDWLCVSPKGNAPLKLRWGDELKLVFPQAAAPPERFAHLHFRHFFLQPLDNPRLRENTRLALDYCRQYPQWHLSLQTHKILGIP